MTAGRPLRPYGYCCVCAQRVSVNIHGTATGHNSADGVSTCPGSEVGMDRTIADRDERVTAEALQKLAAETPNFVQRHFASKAMRAARPRYVQGMRETQDSAELFALINLGWRPLTPTQEGKTAAVIERDGFRVYPVRGEYVIADDSGWLDGSYATVEDALQAGRAQGGPARG